jgi:hypothetical protein
MNESSTGGADAHESRLQERTRRAKLAIDMDRSRLRDYAAWAVFLASLSLILEQIPGTLLHLAPSPHSALRLPRGYVLNDPHLSITPYWHIEHIIHAHVRYGSIPVDVTLRLFIAGVMSIMYASRWKFPVSRFCIRAGMVLMGATLASQAVSFVLWGGVIDLIAHTTRDGLFLSAVSISDLYSMLGIPMVLFGFFVLWVEESRETVRRRRQERYRVSA